MNPQRAIRRRGAFGPMTHWLKWAVMPAAAAALASCNSAGDVLQPSAAAPPAAQSATGTDAGGAQPAGTASPPAAAPSAQAAAVLDRMRLQIAPLVGTSVEAAAPLTERLNVRARERGITLVGSSDTSATHILKGYFSVLTEGKDTTVVYVWDVYDPAGNRLHRINGQQKAPTIEGGKGWAAVAPATMQAVADSTIEQLVAWVAGRTG
jgi:hypothetical protein